MILRSGEMETGLCPQKFVSSDAIEFALISGPYGQKKRAERFNISGVLSHSKMNSAIEMFSNRTVAYDLE